jgi:type I restriction enzyme S subunit
MSDLKSGWRRVKFSEVVRLVRETCKAPASAGIERVIGLEHLEPGDLRIRSWAEVADGTTFTNRVRRGQVLFGKRRAYQRKVAVADFDAICSGDIYVFESANPERLLPELLPFICQTDAFFEYAVGTSAGSLSPRTNWTSLAQYEFALPPLNEQQRIVIAASALLQAIVAYEELATRAEAQREAIAAEYMEFAPRDEFSSLGTLATRVGVGIATSAAHAYREAGVPMIRNTDILPGSINVSDLLYLDPAFDLANASKRVRTGDVVVARTGVPGTAASVPAALDGSQTFTTLIVSPRRDRLDPDFLTAWINGPVSQRFIRSRTGGGVQQNMNATLLKELPTWCPPLAKQQEVVGALRSARQFEASARKRLEQTRDLLRFVLHSQFDAQPAYA